MDSNVGNYGRMHNSAAWWAYARRISGSRGSMAVRCYHRACRCIFDTVLLRIKAGGKRRSLQMQKLRSRDRAHVFTSSVGNA